VSVGASSACGPHFGTRSKADEFEARRPVVIGCLIFVASLLAAYWLAWSTDRSIVASDHTAQYVAFEQAFPLADAWLFACVLMAAAQIWRRRPSAFLWLEVVGGVGLYLCALDVLYDIQHGIYANGTGGSFELGINLITAILSIGVMRFGWRFRNELLGERAVARSQHQPEMRA
jgi:tryptophan-rich sensory protein